MLTSNNLAELMFHLDMKGMRSILISIICFLLGLFHIFLEQI